MNTEPESESCQAFAALGLSGPLLQALAAVGYETPSPIQSAAIPPLLEGRDLLGQAQTGTGKTAAFALPLLQHIDTRLTQTQALVLTPTRELAIQVAEAFQRYASKMPGFHVLPIYGGQSYKPQLDGLRRGAHVVVGTPGRVIDHLDRGTLALSNLRSLVLDEADEMLRMGFIDDVEKILDALPEQRQLVLFSATVPDPIRRIAQTHLREPVEIAIRATTATAIDIRQRVAVVHPGHKLEALTRILETEDFEAMIIFARTKQATEELAEKLAARGFAAAAIHGDIVQAQRERAIGRLREGSLDILVATDVAARGLDVERVSHVLNFDVPYDAESYVHRIGRTGRAGRKGDAILFLTPRERHMLRLIERATRQPVEPMVLPTVEVINAKRIDRFRASIEAVLDAGGDAPFRGLVETHAAETDRSVLEIAAALAALAQGDAPLLLAPNEEIPELGADQRRGPSAERPPRDSRAPAPPRTQGALVPWQVAVGHRHNVRPGNLVGAIGNEGGLDGSQIGRIDIREAYSLVDLPADLPQSVLTRLAAARVAGQTLRIRRWMPRGDEARSESEAPPRRGPKPGASRSGGDRPPTRSRKPSAPR